MLTKRGERCSDEGLRACTRMFRLSLLAQHLLHVRDEAAVFEDGEDFLRQRGKVMLVTFVAHDSAAEIDRGGVVLVHRVSCLLQFDHRQAVVDCVSKKRMREKDFATTACPH